MNNFYRTILALVAVFVLAFSTFPPNSDAKSTISTDNVDKDKVKSEAEFIADHTIDVSKKTKENFYPRQKKQLKMETLSIINQTKRYLIMHQLELLSLMMTQ